MTPTVRAVNTGCVIGFHKPTLGDAEATHIPAGLYTDLIQYEASFTDRGSGLRGHPEPRRPGTPTTHIR
jgi:hypothetical protein